MGKFRKTKIVCTIGPACANEEILTKMCLAGMNVARLNFSHGTYETHQKYIDLIKSVREKLNVPIAIMLDTKGPEYRIGTFENDSIELQDGDMFVFTTDDIAGTQEKVSVSYKNLPNDLKVDDKILVNNGLVVFKVVDIKGNDIYCRTVIGGKLSNNKSMSFPGKVSSQKYLSEQDKNDILFGLKNDIDFIACSFVSCKQNLLDVQALLNDNNKPHVELIAKIENRAGVDNIEEICEACDGIMVARGDLGVEIPFVEVPAVQKNLLTKCRLLGKRAVTATEMLESMTHNPRPTRAEISDVANAIYDGTSAIMLSGETAAGDYPVEAVQTMADIARETEKNIDYSKWHKETNFVIKNMLDAISHATCGMPIDIHANAITVCSLSGKTARMVSRFRPPADILGLTVNQTTWRKLALSWGVTPVLCDVYPSTEVLFFFAKNMAQETFNLQPGDKLVLTGGIVNGQSGNTNTVKIEVIE